MESNLWNRMFITTEKLYKFMHQLINIKVRQALKTFFYNNWMLLQFYNYIFYNCTFYYFFGILTLFTFSEVPSIGFYKSYAKNATPLNCNLYPK
jgi:hypothetical protein